MPNSHVVWACQYNQRLLADISSIQEKYNKLPSYLDGLIKELRDLGCINIQEKFRGGQLLKIDSILAELESARHFLKIGFEVELLGDDFLPRASPDILIRKDGCECLVEVTHLKSSDPSLIILDKCRRFLEHFPYRIDIEFRNRLSPPYITRTERYDQSDYIQDSLHEFRQKFNHLTGREFPIVIETNDIIFTLRQIDSGSGYPGIFLNSNTLAVDFASDYLAYRISEKAEKRDSFPPAYRKVPYIICLVCDEDAIDLLMLRMLLYGDTVQRLPGVSLQPEFEHLLEAKRNHDWKKFLDSYPHTCPYWGEILDAMNRGCLRTLLQNYLIPHDYCAVEGFGLYLTDRKMRNVSGIMFIQRGNQRPFLSNPFCDIDIFDGALENL